jgi:hypothetical protein
MSGQPSHICFYSNRDPLCKAFISQLAESSMKREFRYICVDPSPQRPKLPDWLKKVPTIVIAGETEPRVGQDCVNWMFERNMRVAAEQNAKATTAAPANPGASGGEFDGWNSYEHQSFSRGFGYSYMDSDTSTTGEGGSKIPGAFSFLNGASAGGDRAAQEFPGGATNQTGRSRSKKEELFDKQMEAYQRSREDGMPQRRAPQ